MKDFLTFRSMLTPILIQAMFWVGTVIAVVVGLGYLTKGAQAQYGGGPLVLWGLLILLFGPLLVRLYCEILIIFFRIHDSLTEIKHVLEHMRVEHRMAGKESQE
jgi:hypothetical protein